MKNFLYLYGVKQTKNNMKPFVTKVVKFSQNITPFGGISYVNHEFNNCGLPQLIDNELCIRGNGTGYSHSELFRSRFNIFFCGGECAEDIQVHLRNTLEQIPGNKVASPDTMLREIKSLAGQNTEVISSSGKSQASKQDVAGRGMSCLFNIE